MFDIIVIGAGPAGATFARLAAPKHRILVLDKAKGGEKCCGGLIAPDAQALLASFDIGIPKRAVSDPQLLYVRSIDLETNAERNYQRHYTNVDRKAFDEFLQSLLPPAVRLRTDCLYLGHRSEGGLIRVRFQAGEAIEEESCRILVGADGAYSKVRLAEMGDFKRLRKYLAIQGEYERLAPINHYAVFFDRRITDFYSWLIPKDEVVLVGGAFLEHEEPRARYTRLVAAVKAKGYELGSLIRLNASFVLRPRLRDLKLGKNNVALIGEAAGFISPSSAEGLSYAYASARALAVALASAEAIAGGEAPGALEGGWLARYARLTRELRLNIAVKLLKSAVMYNHFLRKLIFKSKIGSL